MAYFPVPRKYRMGSERAHPKHDFACAVWDVIMDYTGVINDDEMREELEDILRMYYELNGDGTAGEA